MATKTFVAKVPLSVRGEGQSTALRIVPVGGTFEMEEASGDVLVAQDEASLAEELVQEPADEDYTSWKKDALVAEAERRGLVVTGSGVDGNVLADDLRLALMQDDFESAGGQ
jgi:hypothetical protein